MWNGGSNKNHIIRAPRRLIIADNRSLSYYIGEYEEDIIILKPKEFDLKSGRSWH